MPTADSREVGPPHPGGADAEWLPLLSAAEMQRWDRHAVERHGVPERVLMEVAGRSAAGIVQRLYPGGRVVAAVGGGNNGGDAIVLLRILRGWGREVAAVPTAGHAWPEHLLHGWELPVCHDNDPERVFRDAGVIVDGLLGTGARGAPRGQVADMIRAINDADRPVVSLDGPSGIDMTTGQAADVAVRADVTVAFGAPKRGLLLFPGRAHAGRLLVVEIGFPPPPEPPGSAVITPAWARSRLPAVPPDAHKGTVGSVLVVAGRVGMAGASVLAGMAAARAGAGLVRIASPAGNRIVIQVSIPEALYVDRETEELAAAVAASDAIVAGPGMGTDDSARAVLQQLLDAGDTPVLLDADALTMLAGDPDMLQSAHGRHLLLTPHPGEMARLQGREIGDVTGDPFSAAAAASKRYGATVLLKGAPSLVASAGEPILANVTGHSGIATGGTGDTLAGIAGAFLARGCSPLDAASLALYYSGRAAEIAGMGRSLLPRDIAAALPEALAESPARPDLDVPGVILDLPPPR